MTAALKLDQKQVSRALDVLEAHQSTLQRYFVRYRWLKITFYIWFAAFIMVALSFFFFDQSATPEPENASYSGITFWAIVGLNLAQIVLLIAMVALFVVNLPFGLQIFKQERLRRRLGIDVGAMSGVKGLRKPRVIMMVASVFGVLIAIMGTIEFIDAVLDWDGWFYVIGSGILIVGGLSVPLLWLLSRGVDRLQDISTLRERLSRSYDDPKTAGDPFELTAPDYDRLSRLEKRTTQMQRAQSVEKGIEFTQNRDVFAVQRSTQAQYAIEALESSARYAVEKTIFELMTEPRPPEAKASGSSLLQVQVPDTSLVVAYDVDDNAKRVRVHYLQSEDIKA